MPPIFSDSDRIQMLYDYLNLFICTFFYTALRWIVPPNEGEASP